MSYTFGAISNWKEAVWMAGANVLTKFIDFLPNFFGALFIFLLGLILAKLGRTLIVKILGALKLDKILRKSGLDPFLKKADFEQKTEVFFGELIRWLIIIVFSIAGINVLGLTTVSTVLNGLLAYIPKIISAVLILAIGVLLAGFIENLIKGALNQVEPKTSRLVSKIGSYLVVITTTLAAVNELGIAQSLINTLFIGVIATLTIGIGLAIGLGAKDLISKILMEWYLDLEKKADKK